VNLKNCFAIIGLVSILIIVAVGVIYFSGAFSLEGLFVQGTPVVELPPPAASTPTFIPISTPTPTLIPEPTPVPDPMDYRTRVLLRARQFAAALEAFWDSNERVQENPGLFDDPEWRSEIRATLDEFVNASESLSAVKPAPDEYQAIDAQLSQIGVIAVELEVNYLQGLETGDERYFEAVNQNINQIVEHLTQAQVLMIAAGWEP
jgi:hypothetical protein